MKLKYPWIRCWLGYVGMMFLPTLTLGDVPPVILVSNTITVKAVEFTGNTAFSVERLQAEAVPFLDRVLDDADIEELRYRLTRIYVDHGYINSGAVVESYDHTTQYLHVHLVEGLLKEIQVNATPGLHPSYVAERLQLARGPPFHLATLQERFLLLLDDPLIASLHGNLIPGSGPSDAILQIDATERRRYDFNLTLDNHNPVSLGEARALLSGTFRNLSGWGDATTIGYSRSDGNHRSRVDFSIPLSPHDTRFHASSERGNALVVEEPAAILDVASDYTADEIGWSYPLIQRLQRSIVLGLSIGWRTNTTKLLGKPFPLSQESVDGKSTVVPLRFTQEWIDRDLDRINTLRSTISVGTSFIDDKATKFLTWVLQQRYARQWLNNRLQLMGRIDIQFADSSLPLLEKLGIGGANTVRGYREQVLIRDQALLTSLELRYGLLDTSTTSSYGRLEGVVFTDFARGWNKGNNSSTNYLASLGLGLLWSWRDDLRMELYWGHALRDPPYATNGTWQDHGIHFQLRVNY